MEPEDLRIYVYKKFHRSKILDFMRRDYPSYNWNIATLDRCDFFTFDNDTSVDTVKEAVKKEIVGRGKFLGYRLLSQKLRNGH